MYLRHHFCKRYSLKSTLSLCFTLLFRSFHPGASTFVLTCVQDPLQNLVTYQLPPVKSITYEAPSRYFKGCRQSLNKVEK